VLGNKDVASISKEGVISIAWAVEFAVRELLVSSAEAASKTNALQILREHLATAASGERAWMAPHLSTTTSSDLHSVVSTKRCSISQLFVT
jgi:hypothetical protein